MRDLAPEGGSTDSASFNRYLIEMMIYVQKRNWLPGHAQSFARKDCIRHYGSRFVGPRSCEGL